MSPCSLVYVIRPLLLHCTASPQLFMAQCFYCTTVAFVLFCVLSLSLSEPLFLSIASFLSVAQRQVVISSLWCSFELNYFFYFFCPSTYLRFSLLLFCVPFLLLFHLHHKRHHFFFSLSFSFFSLLRTPTSPGYSGPHCSALPLEHLSLAHDLLPFLSSPPSTLPLALSGLRMSDAAQSAPR